jgi:hypothetical protein
MRGRHSIWRRWGRYQGTGHKENAFFYLHKTSLFYAISRSL